MMDKFNIPTWLKIIDDPANIPIVYNEEKYYTEYIYSCIISSYYTTFKFEFNEYDFNEYLNVALGILENIHKEQYSFPFATVLSTIITDVLKHQDIVDVRGVGIFERILKLIRCFICTPYYNVIDPIELSRYIIFLIEHCDLSNTTIELIWQFTYKDDMIDGTHIAELLVYQYPISERILNRMKLLGNL